MARQNFNKQYICVGENFKDNAPIGDCGDVRTLMGWLTHLYSRYGHDEEYFRWFFNESYSNKDIVEYIYKSVGKRLKAI